VTTSGLTLCVLLVTLLHKAADLTRDNQWVKANDPAIRTWLLRSVVFLAGISILKWLIERNSNNRLARTEDLMLQFHKMVATIVQDKLTQMASVAAAGGRKLESFVLPEPQLDRIFSATADFLRDVFGLEEQQIDVTVLARADNGPWTMPHKLRKKWQHPPPDSLVAPGTCAYVALGSGQFVFHASKQYASARNRYSLGTRDTSTGDGSIFCDPLIFSYLGHQYQFAVCIVTYGKLLCGPADEDNERKVKALLREITRRIELELYLLIIKKESLP